VTVVQTLRDIAPWLALSSAVLALALLVLGVLLWTRLRAVRRGQVVVMGAHDQRDIVAHSEQLASQVRNLRAAVEDLTDKLEAHKRRLQQTLTHRALIRYDAFRDAGGEQSATLVLLDDRRSGFVISAIAARDFARVYVKTLEQGIADRELSPEERRAVAEAVPEPLPPRSSATAADAPERPGPQVEPPPRIRVTPPPEEPPQQDEAERPLAVDDDFVWESPGERGDQDKP
jgi:outer membrane murein-binding lipoprotein Lpp